MLSEIIRAHFNITMKNPHQIHKAASRRKGIPCILLSHDWRGTSGAVDNMKLERDKRRFYNRKVLFLVRDPRDVVVSNYYQKRFREYSFEGTIHEFVHDPVRGIESIVNYYNVWARECANTRAFQIVRYEDMRCDTTGSLINVLNYCGFVSVPRDLIDSVVERYEFQNMQRMEREGRFNSRSVTPGEVGNPDSFKARAGKIGGYRDHLDIADQRHVDDLIADRLDSMYSEYIST